MIAVRVPPVGTIPRPPSLDEAAAIQEPMTPEALVAAGFAQYAVEQEQIARLATESADKWVFHAGVQQARMLMASELLQNLLDWYGGTPIPDLIRDQIRKKGANSLVDAAIKVPAVFSPDSLCFALFQVPMRCVVNPGMLQRHIIPHDWYASLFGDKISHSLEPFHLEFKGGQT